MDDFYSVLFYVCLISFVPTLFTLIKHFICNVCLHSFVFLDEQEIDCLDNYISKYGAVISGTQLQGRVKPRTENIHLFYWKETSQWIFAYRGSSSNNLQKTSAKIYYCLYSYHPLMHLRTGLFRDQKGIMEMWFEPTPHDWQFAYPLKIYTSLPVNSNAYSYQKEAIVTLIKSYSAHPIHSVSCIIKGPTKCGKSTTARYLAYELKKLGYSPIVVSGFSPSIPGMILSLLNNEFERAEQSPMILVLDEYDQLVDSIGKNKSEEQELDEETKAPNQAEQETCDTTMKESRRSCYTCNKSMFCTFMDRLAALSNLIVVATTNVKQFPSQDNLLAFYNSARLNHRFDFTSVV